MTRTPTRLAGDSDPAPRRTARRWVGFAVVLIVIGIGLIALDYARFVNTVQALAPPQAPRADGIVVVTGDSNRIEAGLFLLVEGHAERLLISGVHPATSASMLANITGARMELFECCVDLDRAALDTAGNARETRAWADEHGFSSLIVVTSSYHVPRTLAELRAVLPGTELIAYPVDPYANERAGGRQGWPIELLVREYAKLTLARLRRLGDGETSVSLAGPALE